MRKGSKGSKTSAKSEPPAAAEGVDDVKVKAVNEMMERIKHGVVLRPVKSQDSKRAAVKQPPPCEEKQQESAMDELKGILETVKRSPSRGSQEAGPKEAGPKEAAPKEAAPKEAAPKDSELEVILRRRRNKAGESGDEREGHMTHLLSSDHLNGRRGSSDSGKGEGSAGLSAPLEADPGRRGSGPGPVVARRRSSDTGNEPGAGPRSWQEERSCSGLSINGCTISGEDNGNPDECVQSNGVDHTEPCVDAAAARTDAKC